MAQDIIKNIPLALDINASKRLDGAVNIRLYSKDIATGQFEFTFIDEDGDPVVLDETYSAQALVRYNDEEKTYLNDMTIDRNVIRFIFPHNFITKDGIITMYIYITKDNYTSDVAAISFPVFVSEIDKELDPSVAVHYIGKIEQLIQDMKDEIASYQVDVDEIIEGYEESISKLQALDANYKPQLTSLTAQLAQKANVNRVRENTNTRPINVNEMDTETKQLFTGGSVAVVGTNSTGTENLKYKSVTPTRTSFIERGKNLFDKKAALKDVTISKTGVISQYALAYVSDFIEVSPNVEYILSADNRIVVFYDAYKNVLEGIQPTGGFFTPDDCYYIRVSAHESFINNFQMEHGNVKTQYEPFAQSMKGIKPDMSTLAKGDVNGGIFQDHSISATALDFVEVGKNLYKKANATPDVILNTLGETTAYDGGYVSEYIRVDEKEQYTMSHDRRVAFYNHEKNFINYRHTGDGLPFTTPANAYYLRVMTHFSIHDVFQLEKGSTATEFEPPRVTLFPNDTVRFGDSENDLKKQIIQYKHLNANLDEIIRSTKNREITLYGHTECVIPTYDNIMTVAHPSVIKTDGWGGYDYWMAMTPYPHSERENPSIVASNDGIIWETPDGLTNPLFSNQDAVDAGYGANSDTHLIMSEDGTTLLLYWRPMNGRGGPNTKGEGVLRKTSTDGVNWSEAIETLSVPRTLDDDGVTELIVSILSPSVLIEDDGTFSMWTVNLTQPDKTQQVEKRFSTDGLSWGTVQSCTIPTINAFQPWHLDVHKHAGQYHMLLQSNNLKMVYLTSPDGITWTLVSEIPKSGFPFDKDGHYRSAMLPKDNGNFDLWINGIRKGAGGAWDLDGEWRIAYYPDVDLANGNFPTL